MTIKGIHVKWNNPIIVVMLITIAAALAVVIRNPEAMRYTFHSAVDQPEWMRLHNFYQFVYSPKNDNWGGRAEKWLEASNGDWYFVTPENELFAWDGSREAAGELVASGLDPSFYQLPPTTISSSLDVAGAAVNLQRASALSGASKIGAQSAPAQQGPSKCVAEQPSIIIRACESSDCRQLDSLAYGTRVTIQQEKQGWYELATAEGSSGWAAASLLANCDALQSSEQVEDDSEPEPTIDSDYPLCDYCTHYEVSGMSGDEVYDNMRAGAPVVDGNPMAGVTRFSWSYQVADCTRMDHAHISTSIETSMPHWVNFAQGSGALQAEWLSFYNALLVHEDGHRQQLVLLTSANEDQVLNATECEQANTKVKANHASFRDRNLAYDQETDHGRTQGADAALLRGK